MSLLRIAIVGRPNVGKSSLLNMLAREKVSIVDPTPGVTRDRVSIVAEIAAEDPKIPSRLVEVVDTGGYGVYVADGARFNEVGEDLSRLTGSIEIQIREAVGSADLVLFVIDAQAGVVAADQEVASLLRSGGLTSRPDGDGPRVVVVANKVDDSGWEAHAIDAASLGFGDPLMVSASTNYRRRDFTERLHAMLPDKPRDPSVRAEPEMRVAIVGKRNAGKSTFVNALAGEDRVIVSEIAGTTRDAVDVRFERDGKTFVAIDTAGVRKRKSLADQIEWWAYSRARASIVRADVVLLVIDATENISQVDKQLSGAIQKAYKPCIIVVNKWDLAEGRQGPNGKPVTMDDYRAYIDRELRGLTYCPIAFTSAIEGGERGGPFDVVDLAFELHGQVRQRVTTGALNRTLRDALEMGPSSKLGRKLRLFFAAQIGVAPPTIALVVNDPDLFTPQHERFVINRIRENLPFAESPIRLLVRARRRDEREAQEAAGPAVEALSLEEFEAFGSLEGLEDSGPTTFEDFDELDEFDEFDGAGDDDEPLGGGEPGPDDEAPAARPARQPRPGRR